MHLSYNSPLIECLNIKRDLFVDTARETNIPVRFRCMYWQDVRCSFPAGESELICTETIGQALPHGELTPHVSAILEKSGIISRRPLSAAPENFCAYGENPSTFNILLYVITCSFQLTLEHMSLISSLARLLTAKSASLGLKPCSG